MKNKNKEKKGVVEVVVKIGRPTKGTEELKAEFCQLILEGKRMREACNIVGIDKSNVLRWLNKDFEFRTHYTYARELYVENFIEEIVEGVENVAEDKESIAKERLIAESKIKLLEKVLPKKYGQHIRHDHTFELMSERIKRIRVEEDKRISGSKEPKAIENQGNNGKDTPTDITPISEGEINE